MVLCPLRAYVLGVARSETRRGKVMDLDDDRSLRIACEGERGRGLWLRQCITDRDN